MRQWCSSAMFLGFAVSRGVQRSRKPVMSRLFDTRSLNQLMATSRAMCRRTDLLVCSIQAGILVPGLIDLAVVTARPDS
jgi:hypothetical protein